MDLSLDRADEKRDGIFGEVPELKLVTLEHAYPSGDGTFHAKVPQGRYKCVRGEHTMHTGEKIKTFEITGVPGHSGILFHPGNYNEDSIGCVCPGMEIITVGRDQRAVTQSRVAWHILMDAQEGVDSFFLTINGPVAHN